MASISIPNPSSYRVFFWHLQLEATLKSSAPVTISHVTGNVAKEHSCGNLSFRGIGSLEGSEIHAEYLAIINENVLQNADLEGVNIGRLKPQLRNTRFGSLGVFGGLRGPKSSMTVAIRTEGLIIRCQLLSRASLHRTGARVGGERFFWSMLLLSLETLESFEAQVHHGELLTPPWERAWLVNGP
ncbi:hypothetical protein BDZ45DRAFT_737346 [Acephala macrosclerotiorum]|nr:hypothetical protein BDZ45DRAFT_737346 [Acephala macrosclerotiorum]